MLPNRLISQNPAGIMLFLALSEAIHCQTKRVPKIKFPVQPRIFQAFTSTAASCKIAKSDCMRRYRIESFWSQLGARSRLKLPRMINDKCQMTDSLPSICHLSICHLSFGRASGECVVRSVNFSNDVLRKSRAVLDSKEDVAPGYGT